MTDDQPPTQQQPAGRPPQYCRTCQAELVEGAAFCSRCGRPQSGVTPPPEVTETQVLATPVAVERERVIAEPERPVPMPPSSWLTPGVVLAVVGVLVLLVGAGLFLASQDDTTTTTTSTSSSTTALPGVVPLPTVSIVPPPSTTRATAPTTAAPATTQAPVTSPTTAAPVTTTTAPTTTTTTTTTVPAPAPAAAPAAPA